MKTQMKRLTKKILPMETMRKSNFKYENIEKFVVGVTDDSNIFTEFMIEIHRHYDFYHSVSK